MHRPTPHIQILKDSIMKTKSFQVLALLAALPAGSAMACATCGCSLSSDAAMGYSAATGWSVSLQYDYINQSQYRTGTSSISQAQVAAINDAGGSQEVENGTTNHYVTLGLAYAPGTDWNFRLSLPYISRSHSTYGAATNPLTSDQISYANVAGIGDLKFITSYQGFLPTHNLGIQVGVKLPTGNYGGPNASGTGTVGRNPVSFGTTGNSSGQLLDTSLQAGNGSTDLILGAYYYQAVSQNFDAFVNGQFQASVKQQLNQTGADYRPGNALNLSFGLRYEANPDVVPQLQVNITRKSMDSGALADTTSTAGTVAYLSPGVTTALTPSTHLFAFVQVPVSSHLSGYQLFPRWTASLGVTHAF